MLDATLESGCDFPYGVCILFRQAVHSPLDPVDAQYEALLMEGLKRPESRSEQF